MFLPKTSNCINDLLIKLALGLHKIDQKFMMHNDFIGKKLHSVERARLSSISVVILLTLHICTTSQQRKKSFYYNNPTAPHGSFILWFSIIYYYRQHLIFELDVQAGSDFLIGHPAHFFCHETNRGYLWKTMFLKSRDSTNQMEHSSHYFEKQIN